MNEIRLEFVRNGPPHNQLLSPLTQYLAICGDHPVAAVGVPFEHRDLMTRLRRLGAAGGGEAERAAAEEEIRFLSAEMGRILAQIPGLIAEFRGDGAPKAWRTSASSFRPTNWRFCRSRSPPAAPACRAPASIFRSKVRCPCASRARSGGRRKRRSGGRPPAASFSLRRPPPAFP